MLLKFSLCNIHIRLCLLKEVYRRCQRKLQEVRLNISNIRSEMQKYFRLAPEEIQYKVILVLPYFLFL